jgi:stearoyl-CoA desaturase (delta-9 desaturase)
MNFLTKYRILFLLFMLSAVGGLVAAVLLDLWWWVLAGFVYVKLLNFVFLQIGLHRYFSHNSFKTGKIRNAILAFGSVLTGQGSPITWATIHLHHHINSDTALDPHSPQQGFWHTVIMWPIARTNYFTYDKKVTPTPKHLVRNKLAMWVHRNYFAIWTMLIIISVLIDWKITVYLLLAPAGISLLHGNIVTNYLSHVKLPGSYRNFDTKDQSYNNKWIQRFQGGEGLHNNHHKDMGNYNQAKLPNEFDPAAWVVDKFFKIH